jgi:hypothetical protein
MTAVAPSTDATATSTALSTDARNLPEEKFEVRVQHAKARVEGIDHQRS